MTEPQIGTVTLYTRDVSMSGAFVKIPRKESLAVGTMVVLQIPHAPWSDTNSNFSARIVRVTDEGIGLRFVDFEAY